MEINYQNFLVKFYASLHNYVFLPYWFFTPLRRIVRKIANKTLPIYLEKDISVKNKCQVDVIVSFTSFPARINNVWQVVECMLRQTYKPKKIILWLSNDQFESIDVLPDSLKRRISDTFEIKLVSGDIKSHKKYYYVSKDYKDDMIFLIDDDLYYPTDIIERSYKKFMENPGSVVCNYGYVIKYNEDGTIKPYNSWHEIVGNYDGADIFFGSGGGTLFVPSSLYHDLTNIELALSLAPIADDIWLNAMCDLNSLKKIVVKAGLVLAIHSPNDTLLYKSNIDQGSNDVQLSHVISKYESYGLYSKKGN